MHLRRRSYVQACRLQKNRLLPCFELQSRFSISSAPNTPISRTDCCPGAYQLTVVPFLRKKYDPRPEYSSE